MHFPQSTIQPKATMTASMPANPPPNFSNNNSSQNVVSNGYMDAQSWALNNPLFFQPAVPRTTPTPNSIPSETPKQTSNTLSNIPPSSSPFAQAMPTPDWQQQSQQCPAGPSKFAAAWNAANVFPSVNLNTGNRFSQLLEEKLGVQKQRNQQFNTDFMGTNPIDFDFSQYNFMPNSNTGMMPSSNQNPQSGPGLYNSNLLAIENALHDLSQVMIPPDLVAPLPQGFMWPPVGCQESNDFSFDPFTPGLTSSSLGSSLSLAEPNFAQPSPTVSSRNSPKSNQSAPSAPPAQHIPTGPYTWTASAKAYEDSLPPLLKIRVHANEASTSTSTAPAPAPAPAPPAPGTWAVNLVSNSSDAWPSHSPSASSTDFITPRLSNAKIPTPPASSEIAKSRKRQRTDSAGLSSPAGSSSAPRDRMSASASASASASMSAEGRSSSPQPEGRATTTSGGDTEGDGEEKKVIIACYNCRAKKLRCDGDKPKCHHCKRRGEDKCEYDVKLRRRGPGKKNKSKRDSISSVTADHGKLFSGNLPPTSHQPPMLMPAPLHQQPPMGMGMGMMPGPGPMGFAPMPGMPFTGVGAVGVGVNGGFSGIVPGSM